MKEEDLIIGKKYIALSYIISESEVLRQIENSYQALKCQVSEGQTFYITQILENTLIIQDFDFLRLSYEIPKKLFIENFIPIENYYYNLFSSLTFPKIGEVWMKKGTDDLYDVKDAVFECLDSDPSKMFFLKIHQQGVINSAPFKISLTEFISNFCRVDEQSDI